MEEIVLLKNICTDRGGERVLRDVSLTLYAGDCVALAGPSGAGKTELLALLAGRISQTLGEALVFGERISGGGLALAKTGCLLSGEEPAPRRTAWDILLRGATLYRGIQREDVETTAKRFGVDAFAHRRYSELTGGQKQRVKLALAFLCNPRLILLDCPFDGLDPQGVRDAEDAILFYTKKKGAACLMVTGDCGAAQRCCDRAVVLSEGRIAGEFDVKALPALRESYRYSIRTDKPHAAAAIISAAGYSASAQGELVYAALKPKNLSEVLTDLCGAGLAVYEVSANEGGFETRYFDTLELMGGFRL